MLFDDPTKLSNEEIRSKLTEAGYSEELVDSIIQQFWFHDWGNSFLSNPRYFEILLHYLSKTKPKELSRPDFYLFFYRQITSDYEHTKSPLQKIAVVFELMHTDQMRLEEYNSLVAELKTPSQLNAQNLKNAGLLSILENEGNTIVKWLHHTLTEYLAAEYILSQKDPINVANKFMVYSDKSITTLKTSWIGVLRFLLEQNPEHFLNWVTEFINKNPDSLDDNLTEALIFTVPTSIDKALKVQLFHLIFGSYQKRQFWIPVWAYLNLYKFIDENIYQNLKNQVAVDSYIHRGNIAATIGGMLQNKHGLINKENEKSYWRRILINYANDKNDNGVLQRHALAALENFKGDTEIIELVSNNAISSDSLVREAFIRMCQQIDANDPESIKYFTEAIMSDRAHIYARTALYEITSKEGLVLLLQTFASNSNLIHEFLEKESIFNSKEDKADQKLINKISEIAKSDKKVASLIKEILLLSLTIERNYDAGNSYFIQQLALIIESNQSNYIHELVEEISKLEKSEKDNVFINDVEGIFAVLIKPEDVEILQKKLVSKFHSHAPVTLIQTIWAASRVNPLGKEILDKGIALGIVIDVRPSTEIKDWKREEKQKVLKGFRDLFEPQPGKYNPEIFRYYNNNNKVIDEHFTNHPEDKKRFLDLAIKSNLEKIDPNQFKVRLHNTETMDGSFTITDLASYYGDILRTLQKINPEILKEYRQKIIGFIPYAFSSDLTTINELIDCVNEEELDNINAIFSKPENHRRYLIPSTYINLIKKFKQCNPRLNSPKTILQSIISDPKIKEHDRVSALDAYKIFLENTEIMARKLLLSLWDPKTRSPLSDKANELLISVFKDENAIAWRFEILKSSAKPFKETEGGHWVSDLENELHGMSFAKPIIELNDEKYLYFFLDLLNFSITLIEKPEYWEYVNYLWRIAISFIIHDDYLLSPTSLNKFKTWAIKHKTIKNINWFNKRLETEEANVLRKIGKLTLKEVLTLLK